VWQELRTTAKKRLLLVEVSNIANRERKDALLSCSIFCSVSLGFKRPHSSCFLRKCLDMVIPISLILLFPLTYKLYLLCYFPQHAKGTITFCGKFLPPSLILYSCCINKNKTSLQHLGMGWGVGWEDGT